MLRVENLAREYSTGSSRQVVFDRLTFSVEQGETVALLGASGSGKTTLLNLISGIDTPGSGKVLLNGVDVHGLAEPARTLLRRQHVGFVFQFFNLIPTLTVWENVVLPLELNGASEAESRPRAERLLDAVGLADRVHHRPNELSGGQQQRLCIARTIAVNPEVILMDEPCSALDPAATSAVEELIWELRGEYTILIVTHNMAQARRASEECIFMLMGKVVEHTQTDEMFVSPAHKQTADYIEGRFG